jgi:hypothetical protein
VPCLPTSCFLRVDLGEPQRVPTTGAEYVDAHAFGFQLGQMQCNQWRPGDKLGSLRHSLSTLAEDVHGHPERALDAMASLAEWCEGDPNLLARARADVLRDTRGAQAAVAENNREAIELLELAGRA